MRQPPLFLRFAVLFIVIVAGYSIVCGVLTPRLRPAQDVPLHSSSAELYAFKTRAVGKCIRTYVFHLDGYYYALYSPASIRGRDKDVFWCIRESDDGIGAVFIELVFEINRVERRAWINRDRLCYRSGCIYLRDDPIFDSLRSDSIRSRYRRILFPKCRNC